MCVPPFTVRFLFIYFSSVTIGYKVVCVCVANVYRHSYTRLLDTDTTIRIGYSI